MNESLMMKFDSTIRQIVLKLHCIEIIILFLLFNGNHRFVIVMICLDTMCPTDPWSLKKRIVSVADMNGGAE